MVYVYGFLIVLYSKNKPIFSRPAACSARIALCDSSSSSSLLGLRTHHPSTTHTHHPATSPHTHTQTTTTHHAPLHSHTHTHSLSLSVNNRLNN